MRRPRSKYLLLISLHFPINTLTSVAGVPVIGYDTEIFPAFFTNNSGIPSPMNVSDPKIIADMLLSQLKLGLNNGMNYELCTRTAAYCVCVCVCVCTHAFITLFIEA